MAVAFDAKTTIPGDFNNFSGTTGINVSASATFLLLGFEVDTGTPGTPTATWAGASMTQIGTTFTQGTSWSLALFGKVSPTSGNQTLAYSMGAGSQNSYNFLISFTGSVTSSVAAATEGFNVNNNTSTTISVTTATSIPSSDMAVAFAILDTTGSMNNTTTENMGGTQIGENTSLNQNAVAAYFSGSGGTITASAGCTSAPWAAMIVGIAAPGAAAIQPFSPYENAPQYSSIIAQRRANQIGWIPGLDNRWRKWRKTKGGILKRM